MVQAIKHFCLVFALLAWVVFPLPECYLTKPNCPKRNGDTCQTFSLQQTAKAPAAKAPGCAACPNGGAGTSAAPQASNDDGQLPMAKLSPKFLLQESPDLPSPLLGFTLRLPAPAAFPAAAVSWSPVRGGLPDPIPILQRTQTLLI